MLAAHKLLLDKSTGLGRSLERRTIKDVIADKLAALIASGVMEVGDELPSERELAAALSVSRETVRGAIQTLAAKGILEVAHGTRTRVANVDFSGMAVGITNRLNVDSYDLDWVHGARLLIEQQVVGDAAEKFPRETLERLHRSLRAQAACIEDPVQFLICDREFHVAIYRACGNPLLADIVTDLYTYMMDHRRRAISQPGTIAQSFADHQAIVAALEKRDRVAAMAAFAAHEERIYTSTRNLLAQTGGRRR
ncbi:FadR family transcriptional regulator [Arsenicitalea aurantiaca]|uniref:FadR family transcriptional regulator n=1 Tax=Arsenicitalea aurantiaca TaxID=1783274 RepID=A0A433XFH8_9HYPH|nr:FCD domain-containing protein [Arsenicitalea aurantiaca]RUT32822.1 FadR family transcriptional regulator [Arsenicitalea aurantiaca]